MRMCKTPPQLSSRLRNALSRELALYINFANRRLYSRSAMKRLRIRGLAWTDRQLTFAPAPALLLALHPRDVNVQRTTALFRTKVHSDRHSNTFYTFRLTFMVTVTVTKKPWTILLPQVNTQEIKYITTENNYVTLNLMQVLYGLFCHRSDHHNGDH